MSRYCVNNDRTHKCGGTNFVVSFSSTCHFGNHFQFSLLPNQNLTPSSSLLSSSPLLSSPPTLIPIQIDRRYSELKAIGKGSYGVVVSATDSVAQDKVAIKKISPMAAHSQDAKHVLREVRLMRYLGIHENIVTLKNLSTKESSDELYIVMELLDSDLHRIIQSSQQLSDAHNRFFMHQLIKGVSYLHKHNVIHRDLKPGNLLVTRNCELRIADFGLARLKPTRAGEGGEPGTDEAMTEHVVTRWYRPPELMLCPDGLYSYGVDMWSVGCIFAELLGRKPLFPGKNFVHQLTLIFDVIGSPKPAEVSHIKSKQARKFLDSVQGKMKVDFESLYPDCNPVAVDLMKKLLCFEPSNRLSAAEALAHPYFDALKNGRHTDPPVSSLFEFDFESQNLSRGRLKALIMEEVKGVQSTGGRQGQRQAQGQTGQTGQRTKATATSTATATAKPTKPKPSIERVNETQQRNKIEQADEEAPTPKYSNNNVHKKPNSPGKESENDPPNKPIANINNNNIHKEYSAYAHNSSKICKQTNTNTNTKNNEPPPPIPKRRPTKAPEVPQRKQRILRSAQEKERNPRTYQGAPGPHVRTTKSAGSNVVGNSAGIGLYGGPVGRTKPVPNPKPTARLRKKPNNIYEDVQAASNAVAAAYDQQPKGGGVTVPKSPQFSVMSWQKKYKNVEENARARKDRISARASAKAGGGFHKI